MKTTTTLILSLLALASSLSAQTTVINHGGVYRGWDFASRGSEPAVLITTTEHVEIRDCTVSCSGDQASVGIQGGVVGIDLTLRNVQSASSSTGTFLVLNAPKRLVLERLNIANWSIFSQITGWAPSTD